MLPLLERLLEELDVEQEQEQEQEQETHYVHARVSPKLQIDLPSGRIKAENGVFHLNAQQLAELQQRLKEAPEMNALVRLVDKGKAAEIAKAVMGQVKPTSVKGPIGTAQMLEEAARAQSFAAPDMMPLVASVVPQEVPVAAPKAAPLPEIKTSKFHSFGMQEVK